MKKVKHISQPLEKAQAEDPVAKIVISNLSKRYPGKQPVEALSGIDLSIGRGEFVCLLGPSGCGKSTLLRTLNGLQRPTTGRVRLHQDSGGQPLSAMVFQDYSIFPWMTVRQNIQFGLQSLSLSSSERQKRVEEWLLRLGLEPFGDLYPASLSGGMRQRVSIARAFATEPEIFLMDEPFAALDAQLRRVLQEELLALWQDAEGRTVVFVTHSIDEAILLADRVIVMSARPGRIISDVPVPFERPRQADIRLDPEFARLEEGVWDLLAGQLTTNVDSGAPGG